MAAKVTESKASRTAGFSSAPQRTEYSWSTWEKQLPRGHWLVDCIGKKQNYKKTAVEVLATYNEGHVSTGLANKRDRWPAGAETATVV